MRHILLEKKKKKKKGKLHFAFSLLQLQRNSELPSATAGFHSLPSAIANLHIIRKTFTLTYPCIEKSKYKTHPRYIVIIARFQNRLNANVMTQLIK